MRGTYALTFVVAFACSVIATFAVRGAARRRGLVAKPRADRWHKKPTALFGGVGIYIAFIAAYLVHRPTAMHGDLILLACATGMFVLGLVDDLVQLKPYAKLVGQIICSTAVTMFGLRLHWLPFPVADQALTIFWLVGITNAVNLLDNLDGLAGGVAAIAGAYLVYFCDAGGNPESAMLAAGFVGAVLGFLVFNFNPASIFMGDCGSLFIGFFLGGLALVGPANAQQGLRHNVVAVLSIPVLVLMIPILDTALVTISRKLHRRPISQGGRDHTSHRLVALGLSERGSALTLWGLAALSGGIAVTVRNVSWSLGVLLVPAFALVVVLFIVFVGRVRVYQPIDSVAEAKGRAILPTQSDIMYKRRIFEVLCDVVLITLAYYGAFLARWDGELIEPFYHQFAKSLPMVIAVQLAALLGLGLYRGIWRYTSMNDLSTQVKAVAGAWVASVLAIWLVFGFKNFSRGMLIMDGFLLMIGVAASRVSFRLIRTWILGLQETRAGKRVLIYGAGDAGELLLREILNNNELGMVAIGFVDDDPAKRGRVIHGIPVLGTFGRFGDLVASKQIEELVISTKKLGPDRCLQVAAVCLENGVKMRHMRFGFDSQVDMRPPSETAA